MGRSKSKLIYVHRSQFPRFFYNVKKKKLRKNFYKFIAEKKANIGAFYFFWKRSSILNKKLVHKRFALYNGFLFHILRTDGRHQGYRLGEFTATRRTPKHKGKQRQLKKRDKNKSKVKVNKYSALNQENKKKISNRQKTREQNRKT